MRRLTAGTVSLLAAMTVAGCSGFGREKPAPAVDPNAYPTNYRKQIASFLLQTLSDRADFGGALITAPAMKPIGQSQHYVVCLQLNGHNQRRDKVVIYLDGAIQQFIDSKPEQCGDAVYQPFQELADETPPR
jgi:hypothetical protein